MKIIPELQERITPEAKARLQVAHSAAEVLRKNGFECFVAGGFVRDAVLGIPPSDVDIFIKGPDGPCDIRSILLEVLKAEDLIPKGREGYEGETLQGVFSCPLKVGDEVWNADLVLVQPSAYTDPFSYTHSHFSADISRFWLDEKGEIKGTASAQQAVLTKRVDFSELTSDRSFKYFSKLFLHKLLPLGFTATIEGQLLSPNDGEYVPPPREGYFERELLRGRRGVRPEWVINDVVERFRPEARAAARRAELRNGVFDWDRVRERWQAEVLNG